MSEPEFIFDPENKVDTKHGYFMIFGSIISFGILNIIVSYFGKPKSVKAEAWRWNNLVISWIHGLICGTWDILCFVLYPELLDELVHHINYFTYLMIAFSTGYFVYDFIDLALRRKLLANWEVVAHHAAVASMFWYNVHCRMCIAYNVLALMAEINSFFLHSRKLLHMLEYKFDNKFYRIICWINLLTFFFCRGFSLCRLSYALFTEYHLVPVIYLRSAFLAIFVMNVINPVLFWRLFRNDVLRHLSSKPKKTKTMVNRNNNQINSSNHLKED